MGKGNHPYWADFKQVKINNEISHVLCLICKKTLVGPDAHSLNQHRKRCHRALDYKNNDDSPVITSTVSATSDNSLNISKSVSLESANVQTSNNLLNIVNKHENASNNLCKADDEMNIAVLKFFLALKIPLDAIGTNCVSEFFKTFNPSYRVPTASDMTDSIFKKASIKCFRTNFTKPHKKIISIVTHKIDSVFYAISLLNCETNKPTYLHYIKIVLNKNTNLNVRLENFCHKSVKIANDTFRVKVQYIIYKATCDLQEITTDKVIKFKGVDELIKKIQSFSPMATTKELSMYLDFYKKLEELQEKCKVNTILMSDAVKELFSLLKNHSIFSNADLTYKEDLKKIIFHSMHPILFLSYYFHPKYHDEFLDTDKRWLHILNSYVLKTAPSTALDAIGHYIGKTNIFNKLYESRDECDPVCFWNNAKVYNKCLSEYALNLLSIPATIGNINFLNVIEAFETFTDTSYRLRSLIFSILIEDF